MKYLARLVAGLVAILLTVICLFGALGIFAVLANYVVGAMMTTIGLGMAYKIGKGLVG